MPAVGLSNESTPVVLPLSSLVEEPPVLLPVLLPDPLFIVFPVPIELDCVAPVEHVFGLDVTSAVGRNFVNCPSLDLNIKATAVKVNKTIAAPPINAAKNIDGDIVIDICCVFTIF